MTLPVRTLVREPQANLWNVKDRDMRGMLNEVVKSSNPMNTSIFLVNVLQSFTSQPAEQRPEFMPVAVKSALNRLLPKIRGAFNDIKLQVDEALEAYRDAAPIVQVAVRLKFTDELLKIGLNPGDGLDENGDDIEVPDIAKVADEFLQTGVKFGEMTQGGNLREELQMFSSDLRELREKLQIKDEYKAERPKVLMQVKLGRSYDQIINGIGTPHALPPALARRAAQGSMVDARTHKQIKAPRE